MRSATVSRCVARRRRDASHSPAGATWEQGRIELRAAVDELSGDASPLADAWSWLVEVRVNSAPPRSLGFQLSNGGGVLAVKVVSGGDESLRTFAVPAKLSTWHHGVFEWSFTGSQTGVEVVIDGQEAALGARFTGFNLPFTQQTVFVGARSIAGVNAYASTLRLDDVVISRR